MTHTVGLTSPHWRQWAHTLIDKAPDGYVVTIKEPGRTIDQNRHMWPLLSKIAAAKPNGHVYGPERWKGFFLEALGHEVLWERNPITGHLIPFQLESSKLSKSQFSDLLETIYKFGAENGIDLERHPNDQVS